MSKGIGKAITQEDFAETFMLFVKHKGKIPARFAKRTVIRKKWKKLKGDVYFVATGELGLGYWDALKEQKILEALMKDAQKMGGDKDYKVDIGV